MDTPKTSRREFCAHAISLVTVASLVEGCGGSGGGPTNPGGGGGGGGVPTMSTIGNATTQGNAVTVNIDAASPLSSVGSAAIVQTAAGSFLVTRIGQDTFNAMTAICTHEQCVITGFSSGTFVCPCHGSRYSSSGAVQMGPANRNLQTFRTQFTNSVLTITL